MRLQPHIDKLLSEQDNSTKKNLYWLSLYLPIGHGDRQELTTRAKSMIQNALRQHENLKISQTSKVYHEILDSAQSVIENIPAGTQGIALFIHFTHNQHSDQIITHKQQIYLESSPAELAIVDQYFDLTELLRTLTKEPRILIAVIQQDHADFYQVAGLNEKKLSTVNNNYNDPTKKESLAGYKPQKGKMVIHGMGDENVARRQISANKYFLENDVREELEKLLQTKNWKKLIFFISPDYQDFFEKWLDDQTFANLQYDLDVIGKIPPTPEEVYDQAKKTNAKSRKKWLLETFKSDKENHKLFSTNIQSIKDDLKLAKVNRLYLVPKSAANGFSKESSLPTNWLVYQTLASGGYVMISDYYQDKIEGSAAAALRF